MPGYVAVYGVGSLDALGVAGYNRPIPPERGRRQAMNGQKPVKLVIPGTLPNLNDYIGELDKNRHKGAILKKQTEKVIMLCAKSQLRGVKFTKPVVMRYTWYEPNRRRDKDNVSAFGRKCIQDALIRVGVLENDGWNEIDSFSDRFFVDKKQPRVEVEIIPVEV